MSTGTDTPQHAPPAASDVAHEVSVWAVGIGIVATALPARDTDSRPSGTCSAYSEANEELMSR
jgi:hypothetical protein